MSLTTIILSLGAAGFIIIGIVVWILLGLKVVNQYERGVKFTLGKYAGMMSPGLRIVLPIIQGWQRIDIRTKVIDVPDQGNYNKGQRFC